ncbi:hypothetical protein [Alienimonas sp. DA493]|uniref:hypothetical protein n=1 Tax=Alienimonas sp. DA493 TaxID=3373605 RepID=UPI003754F649
MPTRLNRDRVEDALRRHRAWRHGRRAALAAVTAAALGVGGCASLKTPSAAGGKNAALRSLSAEELREVAVMFEAQGRTERAERLFAAADRRMGVPPAGPHAAPLDGEGEAGEAVPPSPIPTAPVQLAESSPETVPPPKFGDTAPAAGSAEAAPSEEPALLADASGDEPLTGAETTAGHAPAEAAFVAMDVASAGDVADEGVTGAEDVVFEDVFAAEHVAVPDAAVEDITVAEVPAEKIAIPEETGVPEDVAVTEVAAAEIPPVLEVIEEAAGIPQPEPAFLPADAAPLEEIAPPTAHVAAVDDEPAETFPQPTDAGKEPEPIPVLQATASADSAASFEEFVAASESVSVDPPEPLVEEPALLVDETEWEPSKPGFARYDSFPLPAGRATLELTSSAEWEASDPDSPPAGRASLEPDSIPEPEPEPIPEPVPFLSAGEVPPEPLLTTDGRARL